MRETINDRNRLEHIIQAIDRILSFADGKSQDDLVADDLIYYGIVKNIEIIGEAANKLSRIFCNTYSDTPWAVISKMRHVLVHDYYQIDSNEIWKVIQEDIQPLREQVVRYLNDIDWDAWEKNEQVITETAAHKTLVQTAQRMKLRGYDVNEICKITGLSRDEIESL